ncbi:MAG: DUF6623 family protein [Acidimicrobiia bacterium]
MARYDMWIHGVTAMVEWPYLTTEIRHTGFGTIVKQPAGTENWLHLTMPVPTIIDDDAEVAATRIAFKATLNENARIKEVHVRMGTEVISAKAVDWGGDDVNQQINLGGEFHTPGFAHGDLPIRHADAPLALCLKVEFLDGALPGEICLRGAGASFDE